jgi:hypothetical protein
MKISDLPVRRTDEGLADWLSDRKANKAAGASKKQQEQAYKIGLKDFTNKINDALNTAVSSGVVSTPQTSDASQQTQGQQSVAVQTGAPGQQGQQGVPTTPTAPSGQQGQQPPAQQGQQVQQPNDEPLDVPVTPGKRLELHSKKDNQLSYYKTEKGWYNALDQKLAPQNTKGLERITDGGGGTQYKIITADIPAPSQPMTKGGKQAAAQAKRQAQLTKKNQQQKQDDDGMNESYRHLNWLLENRILREQDEETVSTFIQNFITGQTSKFPQNPAYVKRTKALADQAESEYLKTKGISDELSKQLWDLIWAWSQLGGSGGSGSSQQSDQNSEPESLEQENLEKTGEFLQKLSTDSSILDNPDSQGFKKEIIKLAKYFIRHK